MDCRPAVSSIGGAASSQPSWRLAEGVRVCFDRAMAPSSSPAGSSRGSLDRADSAAGAPGIERVERFDDARIDDYRNLKDARLAAERRRFIVEGRGNLRVLLERSRFRPASILLGERAFAAMGDALQRHAPGCPIYVAPQALLDRIVGFPIHRGCLAACDRKAAPEAMALAGAVLAEAGPEARIVVLEGITNHDNVGGIFRNAMAFGVGGVLLCPRSCDPLYRKAIRTSMGGTLCVPFTRGEAVPAMLRGLRALGFGVVALDPDERGEEIGRFARGSDRPLALLLGTEGEGLSGGALEEADVRVRIAMVPGVDSLNVAVASGIALHALRPQHPGFADAD
jgi:tRNA G18 (ribose-2'-O)-methylase SpoU